MAKVEILLLSIDFLLKLYMKKTDGLASVHKD